MSISSLLIPLCTAASLTAAPAPAGSDAKTEALTYFQGEWRCNVKDARGAIDPKAFATASTERLRGDWFVTWIVAFHDGTSDKKVAKMTYDPHRGEYVLFTFADDGSYGHAHAKDWDDDSLTFTGKLHRKTADDVYFKKTFTKLQDGNFLMGFAHSSDGEKYSETAELLCEK